MTDRAHRTESRERVMATEAALITGLSLRVVQYLAANGKVPGAAKLGSRWTFDEVTLRRWIAEREGDACRKISIGADASGGHGSGLTGRKSDEAYERLLGLRP